MKTIRESLLRRSFDNHILANRHNKRQDEMLEEKFSLYQRRIHLIDYKTYFAEHRLAQHAQNDLGLVVTYKHKTIEPSDNRQFYYRSTIKNCTAKEYSVEPLFRVLQHKNIYEFVFERRSKQYLEELRQKKSVENSRKEKFMNTTELLVRNDHDKVIDWPTSENARVQLPPIHRRRRNYSPINF
ncbi:unnamed protein product [Rotaria magnacalcarata]|uniref:Uncharacterized protein n=1 Tax=Rotaria magnacalcarata TaxID=392030 RepID=A0A814LJ17_9BILA|nr:unnamed protein product [Rotaria magnacalcarata]CAF1295178.1 unnamed protein product [Rotaria magnacalcarata]CAF2060888.1 unnamed protein product [Rotaria magnacalcarata]CAF2092181.1 unnamed protein product [Rotaria magnacalcarata]CAF2230144.1 unnamed protein product [Rotaria magnacalcarata]